MEAIRSWTRTKGRERDEVRIEVKEQSIVIKKAGKGVGIDEKFK